MKIIPYRYNDFLAQNEYNIAIGISCDHLCHCGLILKNERSNTGYYVHFDFDGIEIKDLPNSTSSHFCIGLERYKIQLAPDQIQLEPMLELCKLFRESNHKYGYSFNYSGAKFDLTLGTLDNKISGLTCATFVIAFLRTFNINILDFESWPIFPKELENMRIQIEAAYGDEMKQKYPENTEEKLNEVIANQLPCARFLPRQVISAAPIADEEPAPFIYCDTLGHCLFGLCHKSA